MVCLFTFGCFFGHTQCMVYLPTFGCFLGQMLVNIPYMEHMGIYIYMFWFSFKDLFSICSTGQNLFSADLGVPGCLPPGGLPPSVSAAPKPEISWSRRKEKENNHDLTILGLIYRNMYRKPWFLLHLVGGFNPSEKYWSVGIIIPNIYIYIYTYGKKCSKTTNQSFVPIKHH